MNNQLEQEILTEVKNKDLKEFASYLGIDKEDLEELYFDVDFDDYSR